MCIKIKKDTLGNQSIEKTLEMNFRPNKKKRLKIKIFSEMEKAKEDKDWLKSELLAKRFLKLK